MNRQLVIQQISQQIGLRLGPGDFVIVASPPHAALREQLPGPLAILRAAKSRLLTLMLPTNAPLRL